VTDERKHQVEPAVPVIWLLGKTGAGKTSLVRALTGEGEVGNGFAPGTRGAATHDFPATAPAVRFLDTRGSLGRYRRRASQRAGDPGGDAA